MPLCQKNSGQYSLLAVSLHVWANYFRDPKGLDMGLLGLDLCLDDLCETCELYCTTCTDSRKEGGQCSVTCLEHCQRIPCLVCAVYTCRRIIGRSVVGTVGGKGEEQWLKMVQKSNAKHAE